MSDLISLKRPGLEVGDRREYTVSFNVEAFDLYGRHHEIEWAEARAAVTRLAEGLHLDLRVSARILTTCDRTLEPVELELTFGDSELLSGPNNEEINLQDWTLNAARYTRRALPNEVPMQVFCHGTEPVRTAREEDEVDPRWRGLDDLFASGF